MAVLISFLLAPLYMQEHLFTYDVIFTLICAGGNHWTLMVRISVCIIEKLMCILPYSGNLL